MRMYQAVAPENRRGSRAVGALLLTVTPLLALAGCDSTSDPVSPQAPVSLEVARAPVAWTVFNVTSKLDLPDLVPGDGNCAAAFGLCTLRASVQEANAAAGPHRIRLQSETYELTLPEVAGQPEAGGSLYIHSTVQIEGPQGNPATIDALGNSGVFHIYRDGEDPIFSVWLEDVVIQGAGGSGDETAGVGIFAGTDVNGGSRDRVTVVVWRAVIRATREAVVLHDAVDYIQWDTTIRDNLNPGGHAGILATWLALAIVRKSTFFGNDCDGGPDGFGGVLAARSDGRLEVSQSTVSDNDCDGVWTDPLYGTSVTLNNVTVAKNRGVGLTLGNLNQLHVFNSIFAENLNGDCVRHPDASGPFVPYRLRVARVMLTDPAPVCVWLDGGLDVFTVADPGLDPLGDYGGLTWTHRLQPSSPAIAQGGPGPWADEKGPEENCHARDQRGEDRFGDCDLGAYERTGRWR